VKLCDILVNEFGGIIKMKTTFFLAGVVALFTSTVVGSSIAEAQALYPACAVCS
jgi:hypothetical protein